MHTFTFVVVVAAAACRPPGEQGPQGPDAGTVQVTDEAGPSSYQDFWFGTYKRGRGSVVADFDGDGDLDVFSGNPGNQSFLIRNDTEPGGPLQFAPWQVLSDDELFYGGVAADFDDDGDADLFVSVGANDGVGPDRMFRNTGDPARPLVDISDLLPLVPQNPDGSPQPNGTMGARAFDADLDGDLDLWASNFAPLPPLLHPSDADVIGLNQLYVNSGDLRLEDHAAQMGLSNKAGTRHVSVFDFDRDGDPDIYENNFYGPSVFWRNLLIESGRLRFIDATEVLALGPTGLEGVNRDQNMCSLVADFDNDGWEDLLVLNRGLDAPDLEVTEGHQLFMNVQGTGFVEVSAHTGLNAGWDVGPDKIETEGPMGTGWGVMGCQLGDVNLDGTPDVFIGTGSGASGEVNRLFVSSTVRIVQIDGVGPVLVPVFDDWSDLMDWPAEPVQGASAVRYPYRTHGAAFADFDGDGVPELTEHNGGPAAFDLLEPNRLWKFHLPDPRFLRVRVFGDGRIVSRDGIGTAVRITVERDEDGAMWDRYKVRRAGSGFGAQNEPDLVFGLADGDRASEVEITWPDGVVEVVTPPDGTQNWITVVRGRGLVDPGQ